MSANTPDRTGPQSHSARVTPAGVEVTFVVPLAGPADTIPPPAPDAPRPAVAVSPDCASVRWGDVVYTFTRRQRLVFAALLDARKQGYEYVSGDALLEAAESDGCRLRDLFRGHPAWGVLIVPGLDTGGPAGTFRLAPAPD